MVAKKTTAKAEPKPELLTKISNVELKGTHGGFMRMIVCDKNDVLVTIGNSVVVVDIEELKKVVGELA